MSSSSSPDLFTSSIIPLASFFFIIEMRGFCSFMCILRPFSSVISASSCQALVASITKTTRSETRICAITAFPPPLPRCASSIMPGMSSTCMCAPLYIMVPGIIVVVVNAYAAVFDLEFVSMLSRDDFPALGNPRSDIVESPVFFMKKPLPCCRFPASTRSRRASATLERSFARCLLVALLSFVFESSSSSSSSL